MARWYRRFGVVLGVALALLCGRAAQAQVSDVAATPACSQSGLTLTQAGQNDGFGLSTFACNFIDNSGPTGSTGTGYSFPANPLNETSSSSGSDNVLATDSAAEYNYSFNPVVCISNGGCTANTPSQQAAGSYSTTYTEKATQTTGNVALGSVSSTFNNGDPAGDAADKNSPGDADKNPTPIYSVDQNSGNLKDVWLDGSGQNSLSGLQLGSLAAGEAYATATVAPGTTPYPDAPYASLFSSFSLTCTSDSSAYDNYCINPGDLLVLGQSGVEYYNGGTLTTIIQDPGANCSAGVTACTGGNALGGDALAVSNDGTQVFVGSGCNASNAYCGTNNASEYDVIAGYNAVSGSSTPDFTVSDSVECQNGNSETECFANGVTGLYTIQSGALQGDLLAETANSLDLVVCNFSNSDSNDCASVNEVVQIATGGSGGGLIGSDFNTLYFNGDNNPYNCGINGLTGENTSEDGNAGQNVDIYTCQETMYLSQATTLDQLTYDGAPLSSGETVPEPASLSLFVVGLAGLGFFRRRRTAQVR